MSGKRKKALRVAFRATGIFKGNPRSYRRVSDQHAQLIHTVNGPWRRFKRERAA